LAKDQGVLGGVAVLGAPTPSPFLKEGELEAKAPTPSPFLKEGELGQRREARTEGKGGRESGAGIGIVRWKRTVVVRFE
jgi:hypothetical protein